VEAEELPPAVGSLRLPDATELPHQRVAFDGACVNGKAVVSHVWCLRGSLLSVSGAPCLHITELARGDSMGWALRTIVTGKLVFTSAHVAVACFAPFGNKRCGLWLESGWGKIKRVTRRLRLIQLSPVCL
jgi:hypothetical protein